MDFVLPNFKNWSTYCALYIEEYIKAHSIYEWLPSEEDWDCSGTIRKISQEKEKDYISGLELGEFNECFLDLLYCGECEATYESGCGFNYPTFRDELEMELQSELFVKMCSENNIEDDADNRYDELYDYTMLMIGERIFPFLESYTKEKVLELRA